ncbi:MAG: hypothetical protein UY69_C0002G0023 [Parcubacteria group bacterium GW2011_GWF1_52_5]|nr:MAG: hypothetical protein UY69_C0002G0023 [Parcubacteria group bacterium GW2011_GWF1_52_5]
METEDKKLITKFAVIFLGVATVFVATKVLTELRQFKFIGRIPGSVNVVTVTGVGESTARPDVAEVSFSIVAEGAKVADVQTKAGDIEKKALAFLKEKNIADKDVKTQNYSLSPRYEYRNTVCSPTYCPPGDNRTLVGYEVRESILVKVRSIDSAGEIVGGLSTLGVTDVSGINLTLDDPDKAKRDARALAIVNAQRKAEELASDLGVALSRIVSFTEGEGGAPPMPYMMEKFGRGGDAGVAVSAAPELPVGENIYRSTVSITYEIE